MEIHSFQRQRSVSLNDLSNTITPLFLNEQITQRLISENIIELSDKQLINRDGFLQILNRVQELLDKSCEEMNGHHALREERDKLLVICKKLHTLSRYINDCESTLSKAECAELSIFLKRLYKYNNDSKNKKIIEINNLIYHLRNLAKASWAQRVYKEIEPKKLEKYKGFDNPHQSKSMTVNADVSSGIFGVNANNTSEFSCDGEGYLSRLKIRGVGGSISPGIQPLGMNLSTSFGYTRFRFKEFGTVDKYVKDQCGNLHRESRYKNLPSKNNDGLVLNKVSKVKRLITKRYKNEFKDYHRIMKKAYGAQELLKLITENDTVIKSDFELASRPRKERYFANNFYISGGINNISITKDNYSYNSKDNRSWLHDFVENTNGYAPYSRRANQKISDQRKRSIDKALSKLQLGKALQLDDDHLQLTSLNNFSNLTVEQLKDATNTIRQQFKTLVNLDQQLSFERQTDKDRANLKLKVRELAETWAPESNKKEDVLKNMTLALFAIATGYKLNRREVPSELYQLHDSIINSGICNIDKLEKKTSFHEMSRVLEKNYEVSVDLGTGIPLLSGGMSLGASASASLKKSTFSHFNLSRSGEYIYVTLNLSGNIDAGVNINSLADQISNGDNKISEQLAAYGIDEEALSSNIPQMDLSGWAGKTRAIMWVFFKPNYLKDSKSAYKYKKQYTRIFGTSTVGLDASASVNGIGTSAGISSDSRDILSENFSDGSLNPYLIYYYHYKRADQIEKLWPKLVGNQKASLHQLFYNIADRQSEVNLEVDALIDRWGMNRFTDESVVEEVRKEMKKYKDQEISFDVAVQHFQRLMDLFYDGSWVESEEKFPVEELPVFKGRPQKIKYKLISRFKKTNSVEVTHL